MHFLLPVLLLGVFLVGAADPEYDRIRDQIFVGALPTGTPVLVMMGGGSASGKSSAIPILTSLGLFPPNATHIDPDEVMGLMSGYKAAVAAGDKCAANNFHSPASSMAKQLVSDAFERSYSIIYDGTMSYLPSARDMLARAAAHVPPYQVMMAGVFCPAAEAAVRAISRAAQTGRYVPLDIIFSSHRDYAANFMTYASLIPTSFLFDTTTPPGGSGHQPLRTVFRSAVPGPDNSTLYSISWASLNNFMVHESALTMPVLRASLPQDTLAQYDALDRTCGKDPTPTPTPTPTPGPLPTLGLPSWVWILLIAVGIGAGAAFGCLGGCWLQRRRSSQRSAAGGAELKSPLMGEEMSRA